MARRASVARMPPDRIPSGETGAQSRRDNPYRDKPNGNNRSPKHPENTMKWIRTRPLGALPFLMLCASAFAWQLAPQPKAHSAPCDPAIRTAGCEASLQSQSGCSTTPPKSACAPNNPAGSDALARERDPLAPPGLLKKYPKFEPSSATTVSVVVAHLSPGGVLPDLPECHQPATICIDGPAPFWLRVNVDRFVYGEVLRGPIQAATTGNQGLAAYQDAKESFLLVLLSEGGEYQIPRYATLPVNRNRSGSYYLLLTLARTPRWLPCSVEDLREPVRAADFPDAVADFQRSGYFRSQTQVFDTTDGIVFPKFGIPLDRLATLLAAMHPSPRELRCEH
jgi:hypothetical protein